MWFLTSRNRSTLKPEIYSNPKQSQDVNKHSNLNKGCLWFEDHYFLNKLSTTHLYQAHNNRDGFQWLLSVKFHNDVSDHYQKQCSNGWINWRTHCAYLLWRKCYAFVSWLTPQYQFQLRRGQRNSGPWFSAGCPRGWQEHCSWVTINASKGLSLHEAAVRCCSWACDLASERFNYQEEHPPWDTMFLKDLVDTSFLLE